MNKKIITVCLVFALILALICCVSCKQENEIADKLREINIALMKDYSKVQLDVNTRTADIELNAKYVMEKAGDVTNISYEVERLNGFDANGNAPSEFISKVSGTATFSGNVVTSPDGDNENVNFDLVDKTMAFRIPYFKNVKISKQGMTAEVINPKGFMQDDEFICDSMTVEVDKSNELSGITIVYVANGTTVTLNYSFIK